VDDLMSNRVLLNNVDHADLRVMPRVGPEFGDAANQLLIFPTEFEEIQREFPIFFRRDEDGKLGSIALLGLERGENLFLGDDGWTSRYVPAIQRRGPFLIGMRRGQENDAPAEPMIHVDLDDPRVGTEGHPVFLDHGGNAPYLEHVAGVLRLIHDGHAVSEAMFAAWEQHGLLQPVTVDIAVNEEQRYGIADLHTISAEALAALGAEALADLHPRGFLRLAFFAAASLGNVGRLIELKNRRLAQAEAGR
jgi:hypothetical protein